MCLLSLPRHHHWLSCSCNCVSSACGAAAENVGDAGEDAGAAVVETAAGQADAGEAAEDEEEEDQANDEPDPPHQPTLSSHTWDRSKRHSSYDDHHTNISLCLVTVWYQLHTVTVHHTLSSPHMVSSILDLLTCSTSVKLSWYSTLPTWINFSSISWRWWI